MKSFPLIAVLFLCFFIASPPARAERVTALKEGGVMQLDTGRTVKLAGLEIPPESLAVLSILLGGRDIEVAFEKDAASEGGPEPVYIFVKTDQITKPETSDKDQSGQRVMVNEFLLGIGAAKLIPGMTGKYTQDFERAQEDAKKKGYGVWSYEEPTAHAPPQP